METYKAVFSCQSAITQIPDSQTIFGAVCNIIKHTMGEKELENYLFSFQNEPFFVHSSMFKNHILPMIKRNVFPISFVNQMVKNTDNKNQLHVLENMKKYKKIYYMTDQIYREYMIESDINQLKQDLLEQQDKFEIINGLLMKKNEKEDMLSHSVLLTRNGFPEENESQDKTLFYSKQSYYPKDTEFCIYLKSNKSKEYLETIFRYLEFFGIGNRRTVGLNVFKLERIENIEVISKSKEKLILSKYIPNEEIEYSRSFYQLNSQIYRASKDYADYQITGKFVHIIEGSYMCMKENKDYYGKVIETGNSDKKIYHYGIGFTL